MISCQVKRTPAIFRGVYSVLLIFCVPVSSTCSTADATQPQRSEVASAKGAVLHVDSSLSMLFVNGEYVESPYEIHYEPGRVSVNGVSLLVSAPRDFVRRGGIEPIVGNGRRRDFASERISRRNGSFERTFARGLRDELESACLLVAFDHYPARFLPANGRGLSAALLSEERSQIDWDEVLSHTESADEAVVWEEWLLGYQIPVGARSRLQEMVDNVRKLEAESQAAIEGYARLERYAYPLTIAAMLLGVVAFGHMLQWAGNGLHRQEASGESERYVILALGMMAGMALIDFVWTVLAGQAGQMTEINPLAARFMDSPAQLAIFKVVATGIGFSILYFWRERHQIQQVAWWMCLVCVLLTFRWVMFDSMRA